MAIYALASLATLALAGTSAAHYGGALPSAPEPDRAGRRTACGSAAANFGCPEVRSAAPRLRLARSGDNPFVSFLKGLFGVDQGREPRRGRAPEQRPPQRAMPPPLTPPGPLPEAGSVVETYRTMCVRLCDGYYWPVSFAATSDRFERDQRVCAQSCGSPAALYIYPNPGGEPEEMQSLQGVPYKSLGTAFLYRTTYDASCKCRPHPWEADAIERHKSYPKRAPKPTEVRAASRGARRAP
jgi:hypothetical protein